MKKDEIIEAFKKLTASEMEQAISSMELIWEGSGGMMQELSAQAEQQRPKGMACPHCKSDKTIKRGSNNNALKYTCKSCGKHFTSTHGSALYRIQLRDKWQPYLKLMEQVASIRRASKELGISYKPLMTGVIRYSLLYRPRFLSNYQELLNVMSCNWLRV